MPQSESSALDWKPVPLPLREPIYGRTVMLEPLDAKLHAADLWNAVETHDEVWLYLFDGPYASEENFTRDIAEKQSATDRIFYAIISREIGAAAGYASFMRMDPANGAIEVGNIMLSPALQRTTAATEAMFLMARHAFDLGYRRYEWKCNAENLPSRRAAERLGFSFEGIFRQHMVIKNRNRDTAWFSMLNHEWPARKAAFEAWLDPTNFDGQGNRCRSLRTRFSI
jgi:RimJ/RimL family protein N-acetyltransferase